MIKRISLELDENIYKAIVNFSSDVIGRFGKSMIIDMYHDPMQGFDQHYAPRYRITLLSEPGQDDQSYWYKVNKFLTAVNCAIWDKHNLETLDAKMETEVEEQTKNLFIQKNN